MAWCSAAGHSTAQSGETTGRGLVRFRSNPNPQFPFTINTHSHPALHPHVRRAPPRPAHTSILTLAPTAIPLPAPHSFPVYVFRVPCSSRVVIHKCKCHVVTSTVPSRVVTLPNSAPRGCCLVDQRGWPWSWVAWRGVAQIQLHRYPTHIGIELSIPFSRPAHIEGLST